MAQFQLRLLGPFALLRDGIELAPHEVGSRKGRQLLALLATARGTVELDRITEALWPGQAPADPAANVATLVSRLRARLGADTLAGDKRGYRLVVGAGLGVDLDQAERLAAEADARLRAGEPALAGSAAAGAVALLAAGPVLADEPDAPWAEPARRAAGRLLAGARRTAWSAALEVGDTAAALAFAEAAVAADPLDEAAHRAVMVARQRAGEPAAALAAYERLRSTLADELGTDPAPETAAVHLAVLRGEPPAPEPPAGRGLGTVRAPDAAFVGRRAELAELERLWTEAAAGRPALVLVTGEAGIGKTRLAAELAGLAAGTGGLVAAAVCHQAERSLFLQPVVEAARDLAVTLPPERVAAAAGASAATLAELVPELRRMLEPLGPYERAPAELERLRAFQAVTALLRGLAVERPLLVVLDDLHQAGASTVELVHFLLGRVRGDRLLVVATVRAEEGAEVVDALGDLAAVVEVGPLPEPAVAELAGRLGVEGGADVAGRVMGLTGGHTLFVVETLRAATEGQGLDTLPASLRDAVLARVRRLGAEVETLLRAGAVLGAVVELEVLAELLGLDVATVAERAERALGARLLLEAGASYGFGNDLIREVLYETTPRPTRVARHRRAAALLADQPEAAAGHAAAAEDWTAAAAAWRQAAEAAAASWALHDAERLLGNAVEAAGHLGANARAEALAERGRIREAIGDYRGAADDLGSVLDAARAAGDPRLEAGALEELGWTAYYARNHESGSELSERAVSLAEAAAAAPEAGPSALVLAGRIRHSEGDLAGARSAFEEVLALPGDQLDERTGALARHCLGMLLTHGDHFAEAAAVLDEAVGEARRAGAFRSMTTSLFAAALAYGNLGDLGAALARTDAMTPLVAEVDDPLYRARLVTTQSWLWRELGALGRATDLASEAVALTASAPRSHPAMHAVLGLAECALLAGDAAAAAGLVDGAAADGRAIRAFAYGWRLELRWLELRARLEPALAEALLAAASARGSAKYEAVALGLLGRADEGAAAAARTGSDHLLALVAPAEQARAAAERLAARLPSALRAGFLAGGRAAAPLRR